MLLLRLPHNLIDGFCHILHIPRIQPCHTDPPILCHVDMEFVLQPDDLVNRQTGKAEHPNLLRDMFPARIFPIQLLQLCP